MIRSMTAYGRGECTQRETVFTSEIKSYNNRYRDLIFRTPKSLQIFENEIQSQIFSRIKRGRVEVFIQMGRNGKEPAYEPELNLPLVRSYFRIFKQVKEEFKLDQKIRPNDLCQMKDVIVFKPEEVGMGEIRSGLQQVLCLALDSFDLMRNQEGRAIEEDFQKRINLIGEYLDSIEDRTPMVVEEYRTRLKDKINNLLQDIEMDESRLIQEVALLADRCDITEEIVRTRSHLKQFHHYMAKDDSIGRRLEFLLQEINREVNTISSKASDSFISAKAVQIKAELEKLREQAQNVE